MAEEPAEKVLPLAQEANVGIIARIPLRRGVLTGKMTVADEQRFQGEDVPGAELQGRGLRERTGEGGTAAFPRPRAGKEPGASRHCLLRRPSRCQCNDPRRAQRVPNEENAAGGDITLPVENLAKVADLWRRGFAPYQQAAEKDSYVLLRSTDFASTYKQSTPPLIDLRAPCL